MRKLSFQVFLWFWLTIVAMGLLISGFGLLHADDQRTRPLPPHIIDNLEHLANNIERRAANSENQLLELINQSSFMKRRWLYLSHAKIEKSLSTRTIPSNWDLSVLHRRTNTEPLYIITDQFSAQGPVKLMIGDSEYQLFQIVPHKEPPFWVQVRMLPWWEKLIAILLPSLLFSWWFSRRLTRPIATLSATARQFAAGKLDARVTHSVKPQFELAELSQEFNNMAQRIEDNMTAQKRLLGDVSHELRSPLTRLLLACGLLESELNEQQTRYLQRIVKEANCLEDMLQSVLTLSRLEGHNQLLDFSTQSLTSVVKDILADAHFEAQSIGKSLTINSSDTIELYCDSALLASAIENILRNAIKYANSNIEFSAKVDDELLTLYIRDDGPGTSEDALQKLCEPFYRTSDSRSRNSGGIGLGLAIAHRAIRAHGGELTLSLRQPHGLQAEIRIPLTPTVKLNA